MCHNPKKVGLPFTFKKNPDLEKLEKILEADFSSNSPTISYINPDGLANTWILISTISTPYILWLLFKLKKFGWLASFAVFVLAPFLYNYKMIENINAKILVSLLTVLIWGIFLFLLKISYKEWREPEF